MGTVYRAKDPAMDRVVALKTILSVALAGERESEFRERFFREARAAGALAHPGIVSVFDVGEHEGMPFLVMEFIDGKTLVEAIKKNERPTLSRVCELGQKIAEALGYAHQRGVVHRDIKPANIMLTSREKHGIVRPKITDFGVAKMAAAHTTATGQMVGTPAFMPPEQFTGAPIDGRADIFSLGVVLYWMATGEQPFPGESLTSVSYKVVHTDPPPPRKLNPSISSKLESIILKCLEKSPDDRYQTGEELARELGDMGTKIATAAIPNVPQASATVLDPEATFVETSAPRQKEQTKPQPLPPKASQKGSNRSLMPAIAAVVAVVAAAGLWFGLRNRTSPPVQEAAGVQEAAPVPQAVPVQEAAPLQQAVPPAGVSQPPVVSTPLPAAASPPPAASATPPADASVRMKTPAAVPSVPVPPASKAPAGIKTTGSAGTIDAKAASTGNTAKTSQAPKAAPLAAQPEAVAFDPRTLNPKENARLKIEADKIPPGLDFTVEMNGKLYFQGSTEEKKKEYNDLYVPPGVHEFRVSAKSGAVQKISNTVSTEFKAKKRNTMKIELRMQGRPPESGVPKGLYDETQLVLSLK